MSNAPITVITLLYFAQSAIGVHNNRYAYAVVTCAYAVANIGLMFMSNK